jgi:hypothetical protein
MNLRPYHDHPLLADYSEWNGAQYYFAQWFCPACRAAIVGPPFAIGQYVIDREMVPPAPHKPMWRVHMLSLWQRKEVAPLFEHPNRRDAIKHARELERNRKHIMKVLAGDKRAIAENHKEVERLRQNEQE